MHICRRSTLSTLYQTRRGIHCSRPSLRQQPRLVPTDDTGIPLQPTWSVDELLASYLKPTISPETLSRLHRLSALVPPAEGTPEHARLTHELEELVKLVEAVRLAKAPETADEIPDGRVMALDACISLDRLPEAEEDALPQKELLARAVRTRDGFYEIPNERVARRYGTCIIYACNYLRTSQLTTLSRCHCLISVESDAKSVVTCKPRSLRWRATLAESSPC